MNIKLLFLISLFYNFAIIGNEKNKIVIYNRDEQRYFPDYLETLSFQGRTDAVSKEKENIVLIQDPNFEGNVYLQIIAYLKFALKNEPSADVIATTKKMTRRFLKNPFVLLKTENSNKLIYFLPCQFIFKS